MDNKIITKINNIMKKLKDPFFLFNKINKPFFFFNLKYDFDFENLCLYYKKLYFNKNNNIKLHNLFLLKKFNTKLFLLNNLSVEDKNFAFLPVNGLIQYDYERILQLDLKNKNDLQEFRLISANLIRVIYENPDKCIFLQDFMFFNTIIEFCLLEGNYDYFNIEIDKLLLILAKHNYIKAQDCAFIAYARINIEKMK